MNQIQLTETSKMIKEIGDSKTKTAIITHTQTDIHIPKLFTALTCALSQVGSSSEIMPFLCGTPP